MLESLNIMFQKKTEVKNVFNGKNESCNLDVSASFFNTIKEMSNKNNFKNSCEMIINALNSSNEKKINLGYSLFILIL
jgi:hemoglobin-like flavoprotein